MFPGKRTPQYPKRIVVWDENGSPIIRKNGKPLAKYSHPTRRLDPNRIDEATKLWLEYRYGWSPLVYDIIDTLKAMYADDLRKELGKKEVLRASSLKEQSQTVISSSTGSDGLGTITAELKRLYEARSKVYILYEWYQPEGLLRRLNDFGIYDVPRAIWEIVPWSFVADWVCPIGDFLGALTPKFGVNILAAGITNELKLTVTRTATGYVSSPPSGNLMWSGTSIPPGTQQKCTYTTKVRTPGLPLPSFPPIEVKLNLKRMVDAVALFRGVTSTGLSSNLRK